MDIVTKILKATANERRVKILRLLMQRKEVSVGTLAHTLNLSFPAISRHLNKLEAVDLIKKRQENKWIFYSINYDKNKRFNQSFIKFLKDV